MTGPTKQWICWLVLYFYTWIRDKSRGQIDIYSYCCCHNSVIPANKLSTGVEKSLMDTVSPSQWKILDSLNYHIVWLHRLDTKLTIFRKLGLKWWWFYHFNGKSQTINRNNNVIHVIMNMLNIEYHCSSIKLLRVSVRHVEIL